MISAGAGSAALLVGMAAAVLACRWLFSWMQPWLGTGRSWLALFGLVALVVLAALVAARQRRRRAAGRLAAAKAAIADRWVRPS